MSPAAVQGFGLICFLNSASVPAHLLSARPPCVHCVLCESLSFPFCLLWSQKLLVTSHGMWSKGVRCPRLMLPCMDFCIPDTGLLWMTALTVGRVLSAAGGTNATLPAGPVCRGVPGAKLCSSDSCSTASLSAPSQKCQCFPLACPWLHPCSLLMGICCAVEEHSTRMGILVLACQSSAVYGFF